MGWELNPDCAADDVPKFTYRDEAGQATMDAFVGGSSAPIVGMTNGACDPATDLCINVLLDPEDDCYAHFCNLEDHIRQMQELAAAYRAWDQQAYLSAQ